MVDVESLILHLQSYRLKTDEVFVNLVTGYACIRQRDGGFKDQD